MKKMKFKEEQKFEYKELFVLITIFILLGVYRFGCDLFSLSESFRSEILGGISLLLLSTILYVLWKTKMKVSINEHRIKLKMFCWKTERKKILWDDVESCQIIKTPLNAQWAGSNISFNREKKYSLVGRNGIYLMTKDGEEYFIGSKKISELEKVVRKILA
jgi:hypothetical protein